MNNKQKPKKPSLPTKIQLASNSKTQQESLIAKPTKIQSKLHCNLGSLQAFRLKTEHPKFKAECPAKQDNKMHLKEKETIKQNKDMIPQRKSDYEKRDVYRINCNASREDQVTTAFSLGRVKPVFPDYISSKNVYKINDQQQNTKGGSNTRFSHDSDLTKRLTSFRKVSFDTNAIQRTIMSIANSRSSNKELASRITCDSANECKNTKLPTCKPVNLLDSYSTVLLPKRQTVDPDRHFEKEDRQSCASFTSISLKVCEHLSDRQNSYGKFNLRDSNHRPFQGQRFNPFVQFITEVTSKVNFKVRVVFLAIELFYFSLRLKPLREFEFKTIALAAISMAAKFEDAWSFYVSPFFSLESVVKVKSEMIEVERQLLTALDFNINLVLVYDLFCLTSTLVNLSKEQYDFGLYFLNSALCFEDFQQSDKRSVSFALCKIAVKTFECSIEQTEVTKLSKKLIVLKIKNDSKQNCSESETSEMVFDANKVEETVDIFEKHQKILFARKGRAISELYSRQCFSGIAKRF